MAFPLHVPTLGLAALSELDQIPWRMLEHAYTGDKLGAPGLHRDVEASLRALRNDPRAALKALYSNVYHQRTVYEATAYAVPFLAAVAADPVFDPQHRLSLVNLLAAIALSSSFSTEDGTSAGAYGDHTAELIRDALCASEPALRGAAAFHPAIAAAIQPILTLAAADPVTTTAFEAVRAALIDLERTIAEAEERRVATPPAPTHPARYRHAKFGDATLLRRLDGGRLVLRFDDGTERIIVERFVELV